ncbi:hypothetical protein XENOCAPTIV_010768 [Xenoophorus captivus]|uniref:Uncharacterized protein n=1 Tax=Xenoophorus captivus TaxID=1517983 RepID=A0ABV0R0S1_9TELE
MQVCAVGGNQSTQKKPHACLGRTSSLQIVSTPALPWQPFERKSNFEWSSFSKKFHGMYFLFNCQRNRSLVKLVELLNCPGHQVGSATPRYKKYHVLTIW